MTAQGGLMANLGNPQETIAVLQRYGFNFQKKYGQNFLIDTHVLDKIIGAAEIGRDDFVLDVYKRQYVVYCTLFVSIFQ